MIAPFQKTSRFSPDQLCPCFPNPLLSRKHKKLHAQRCSQPPAKVPTGSSPAHASGSRIKRDVYKRQEYEYSYVAVIANTDSEAFSSSIYSDFDSYFICDKNESYPLILDQTNEVTYNRESTTIVSPGRKYPYVVNNGIAQYYSGVINVTFIELKENLSLIHI